MFISISSFLISCKMLSPILASYIAIVTVHVYNYNCVIKKMFGQNLTNVILSIASVIN